MKPPRCGIRVLFANKRVVYRNFATKNMTAFYLQEFAGDDYEYQGDDWVLTSDGTRLRVEGEWSALELLDHRVDRSKTPDYFDKDKLVASMTSPFAERSTSRDDDKPERKKRDDKPEAKPRAPRIEGAVTAISLAKELGVEPGHARAALRKNLKPRPAKWEWEPNDPILAEVRKIIKEAKK